MGPEGRGTPGRRRREEAKRWKAENGLPGSSTEEDIADRVSKTGQQQRIVTPKVREHFWISFTFNSHVSNKIRHICHNLWYTFKHTNICISLDNTIVTSLEKHRKQE